jgi:hypothetical protein
MRREGKVGEVNKVGDRRWGLIIAIIRETGNDGD